MLKCLGYSLSQKAKAKARKESCQDTCCSGKDLNGKSLLSYTGWAFHWELTNNVRIRQVVMPDGNKMERLVKLIGFNKWGAGVYEQSPWKNPNWDNGTTWRDNILHNLDYSSHGSLDDLNPWEGSKALNQGGTPPPAPQNSKGSIADEDTKVTRKIFKGTREEYLMASVKELSKLFKQAGHTVPKDVKVTMSLPTKNARPSKIQTIGQCFARSASDGGINEILITPLLNNSVHVLETLTHELAHAIDDCQHGHKTPFKHIAQAVGLEGKMTSTTAGEKLTEKIKAIVKKLGRYPHKKLNLNGAKQGTRLILIQDTECGAKMRVSRKVIDESTVWLGDATCPFCGSVGTLIEGKVENCEGEVDEVEYSPYRWVITKVHLEGEEHVKGMMGGRDCDPNLKSNPVKFSLYDDDDNCYAEGMLYCIDGEEGCYEFAPLDDYGTPNWGCTYIKINGEIL